ncbi:type II toxin-antitoxin system HicB family antitoxin [Candidatus Micrarchaeota archaeon]|nr:type II toxin-antitoxin system HicB family antitoxin [Candidatus Micrarchaeota archaeon]
MTRYTVIVEKDEDGWLVSEVVGLPGCHTQAKTMDELLTRTKEAIQGYLEAVQEKAPSESFVGVQLLDV